MCLAKSKVVTLSMLSFIMVYVYPNKISKNIMKIQYVLGKMSDGDLTENIKY